MGEDLGKEKQVRKHNRRIMTEVKNGKGEAGAGGYESKMRGVDRGEKTDSCYLKGNLSSYNEWGI